MANIDYSRYTLCYIMIAVCILVMLIIGAIKLFGGPEGTMKRYPPWISECPDYWIRTMGSDGTVYCQRDEANPNGRSTCSSNSYNTQSSYKPPQQLIYPEGVPVPINNATMIDKCQWANACDIYWEGVSDVSCTDTSHFQSYTNPAKLKIM